MLFGSNGEPEQLLYFCISFILCVHFQDDDQESITMPNKNGEKFICFLPKVEKSKSGRLVSQQNISSMIVESETRMKLKTPDELLEVLKDRCFIRVKFST